MNIKEAKEQIKNAMTAYFTKDEFGSYAVPVSYTHLTLPTNRLV